MQLFICSFILTFAIILLQFDFYCNLEAPVSSVNPCTLIKSIYKKPNFWSSQWHWAGTRKMKVKTRAYFIFRSNSGDRFMEDHSYITGSHQLHKQRLSDIQERKEAESDGSRWEQTRLNSLKHLLVGSDSSLKNPFLLSHYLQDREENCLHVFKWRVPVEFLWIQILSTQAQHNTKPVPRQTEGCSMLARTMPAHSQNWVYTQIKHEILCCCLIWLTLDTIFQ